MNMLNTVPHKATIKDVAQMAGVSIKTVSRVANGHPNVRESTRIRVQSVIDKLDYSANPFAQYLGSLNRDTIIRDKGVGIAVKTEERGVDWW